MDHHCHWINNCVGARNQKFFTQFLLYLIVLSVYTSVITAYSWFYLGEAINIETLSEDTTQFYKLIHIAALLIECLIAGISASIAMYYQMKAILTDETAIERLERLSREGVVHSSGRYKHSKWILLSNVCGPTHWLFWLLPCTLRLESKAQAEATK